MREGLEHKIRHELLMWQVAEMNRLHVKRILCNGDYLFI